MPYIVQDKILFLSTASKILSSSIDYNVTLVSIAKLVVESVADFCMIDILDDERLQRVVVKMSDQKKNAIAQKFYDFPPDPRNQNAIYDAAKTSSPIIIKKVTNGWLSNVSRFSEEKKLVKELGFSSLIFVPLHSRGKIIGVMTIGSMEKGFSYSEDDAVFIQELADRAAITVDKAMLFAEAQEAIRTRDEFLSIASHELKTPLTSILLSLQLILRRVKRSSVKIDSNEEIIRAIEIGIEQSKRMSRLINDLINVSLTSSEFFQIYPEPVNLTGLVKDVFTDFELILKSKKIELIIKEENQNIVGFWDRIRIEQVVSNLVSNAIKYGNGKPITLYTRKDKSSVIIEVSDKGIGIRHDELNKIFGVFNRSSDVAYGYKGIGVGLFIAKKIVEAHNGEISVSTRVGKGSTFSVKLPLKVR